VGKLFVVLLIVAAFTGTYWAVMSGYVAERAMGFDIRAAAREADAATIRDDLIKAEGRLDSQKEWVKRFSFIARQPDWSRIEASRKELRELQRETDDIVAAAGGEIASEGIDKLRKFLSEMPPPSAGVFRPGQDTIWKVLFWVSAAGAVVLGLLSFIRRVGD
jgi:hypothetical protein